MIEESNMKKIFIADMLEDQVIIQVGQKCYFDTINSFYLDYKKCDFGDIKYLEHNFSANKIIINRTFENTDPFEPLILDILSNIDDILDKQDKRRNPPPATVEEAKELKSIELKIITSMYAQEVCPDMYITSSVQGIRFNADKASQANINALISLLPDDTSTVRYKVYDNSFHDLTRPQLKVVLAECYQNGLKLYEQKFAYEAQLATTNSIDAIMNMKFTFNMMDFSNTESEETE